MLLVVFILALSHTTAPAFQACPSALCTCVDKKTIICSKRGLERVPKLEPPKNERLYDTLDLSRNDIYSIPPNAFSQIRVKTIDLSRNAITGISPRGFDDVAESLQSLILYNAAIKVLHWAVFQKTRELLTLDLARNVMFDIPLGLFEQLRQLETLNLAWNRIHRLKFGVFRHLYNLRRLNLMGNLIVTIDANVFNDLNSLTALKLNSNRLNSVNSTMLTGLIKLQRLELENNFIGRIEIGAFLLPQVQQILLLGNNLTTLGGQTFKGAVHLEELFLQDNRLVNITQSAFVTTPYLRVLKLDRNKLTHIGDHCQMYGLYSLKEISLEDNPIDCGCNMAWLERLQTDGAVITGECATPRTKADLHLQNFSVNITRCQSNGYCQNTRYSVPTLNLTETQMTIPEE